MKKYFSKLIDNKMFLCTKNEEQKNREIDRKKFFEIIGEISPDALGYIKEGQKFDEKEVKFMREEYIPYEPEYPEEVTYKQWLKTPKNNWYKWITIKGPCGHFH